jgi:CcmD family protein
MIRRISIAISWLLLSAPLLAMQAAGQAAPQDGPWVPITELPPSQQLPAAPFLVAAYAFIWVALMAYLWSIWRRLGKVEQEMRALDSRSRKSAR